MEKMQLFEIDGVRNQIKLLPVQRIKQLQRN
jgi:hypothetical protein